MPSERMTLNTLKKMGRGKKEDRKKKTKSLGLANLQFLGVFDPFLHHFVWFI